MSKYYVGLDVGTDSVGWAATDEDYNLLRLKGKDAFGANLFSMASTAKARRLLRTSKRRTARRKYRIQLLNEILAEPISRKDPDFFPRLANSNLHWEDKKGVKGHAVVFPTKKEEAQFYKDFPTIWHLRKALVAGDQKAYKDIRLVYMGIHHIVKYRGNFLKEGDFSVKKFDYETLFDNLNRNIASLREGDNSEPTIAKENYGKAFDIIQERKGTNDKVRALKELLNDPYDSAVWEAFSKLVSGGTFDSSKLVEDATKKINLRKGIADEDYEAALDELKNYGFILEDAKAITDYLSLKQLLGDHTYLCDSMVEIYQKHKRDLRLIKDTLHSVDEKKGQRDKEGSTYFQFFKEKGKDNYLALTHNDSAVRKTPEEVLKFLKVILEANKDFIDEKTYQTLTDGCSDYSLLPLISVHSTSVIPHQLHHMELKEILRHAANAYPSVFNKEVVEKIDKLFLFRVPYYYGPLNPNSPRSNIVYKAGTDPKEKISPWNYDSLVDEDETRKRFIAKLTKSCMYLIGEPVMPKSSLKYEEFILRDQLNTLHVNGHRFSEEEKEKVFDFLHSRAKTDLPQLKEYLEKLTGIKADEIVFSGLSEKHEFNSASFAFFERFKAKFHKEISERDAEEIILLSTIYTKEKDDLRKYIRKEYPSFSKNEVNFLLGLNCTKWATVSEKFVDGITGMDENDVAGLTILGYLRTTDRNFQQILNDPKYRFREVIDDENKRHGKDLTDKERIDEILDATPAPFRRSVIRTMAVLDDVVRAKESAPDKIFIEVTREDNDADTRKAKTKDSRYSELKKMLRSIQKDGKEYSEFVSKNRIDELDSELEEEDIKNAQINGKHVYLYFRQLGYDLYTGEKIDLYDVLHSDRYDTDHIIPQSLIKDDSLDNLVLVDRTYNQRIKQDFYPIPTSIRNEERKKLWHFLHERNLISDKKYNNLIRSTELTEDEINAFVSAQINALNYSNIALRDVLAIRYPDTKLVFSKAQYPSYIRDQYHISKIRELNNAHHAVDAYLNILCGNILSTTFQNLHVIYAKKKEAAERKASGQEKKENDDKTFNMTHVLRYHLNNDEGLLQRVTFTCMKHSALITYAPSDSAGAFYNMNISPVKDTAGELYPIHKGMDPKKYGGYDSTTTSYFYLVSYVKKGKTKKQLLNVKTIEAAECKTDEELKKRLIADNGLNNAEISDIRFLTKIKPNQKVLYHGGIYLLRPSNLVQCNLVNAYQFYLEDSYRYDNDVSYLKFALNHLSLLESDKDSIELFTDRKKEHKIVISKERNYSIFKKLVDFAERKSDGKHPGFESCTFLSNFGKLGSKEEFMKFTPVQQIQIIDEGLKLFTDSIHSKINEYYPSAGKNFAYKPSLNLDGPITLINESPSGLYVRKVTY